MSQLYAEYNRLKEASTPSSIPSKWDPRPMELDDLRYGWRISSPSQDGGEDPAIRIRFEREADADRAIHALELAGISTDQDLDRVGFNEVRRIAIEALAW